jgi:peptidoglycan-N-acetylglucosamine deacetylase
VRIKLRPKIFIALSVVLVAGVIALWEISKSLTFQFFGPIIARVNISEKVVALTFDDGPTPGGTSEILRVLDEMQVKATFFVIGSELESNMTEGRKIVAAGHELGNHSYSHGRMILVSPGFVQQEVETTDRLIREVGYTGEVNFRPPFGKKLLSLPYYLSKTGRTTITWDVQPDANPETARDEKKIINVVRLQVRPGSIILLHVMYPSRQESLKAVVGIVEGLRRDGYRFVTISELLHAVH